MQQENSVKPTRAPLFQPKILTTLKTYDRATFLSDIFAGLTVVLLVLTMLLTVLVDLTVAIGVGVAIGLALRLRRRDIEPPEWHAPDRQAKIKPCVP